MTRDLYIILSILKANADNMIIVTFIMLIIMNTSLTGLMASGKVLDIYRICHELIIEITFYQTSLEKYY